MPRFIIRIKVTNNGTEPIRTHVGASLVGVTNHIEYYNESEDIDWTFHPGENIFQRYLTPDLGPIQNYDLFVALWKLARPIGKGSRYAITRVPNAVEKKKKEAVVNLAVAVMDYFPRSFSPDQ